MKLRNKKTGEIKEVIVGGYPVSGITEMWECLEMDSDLETGYKTLGKYNSIAELNEEWEDYEEPKSSALDLTILTLTNFIENEPDENKVDLEDCKRLLEKLKAWKRLKDKGFKFGCWYGGSRDISFYISQEKLDKETAKDLDLLFGGKE